MKPWPVLNLPPFFYSPDRIIRIVSKEFGKGEDIVEGKIAGVLRIFFFRNPEHIRDIYTHRHLGIRKPKFLLKWANWLMGDGLFNDTGGPEWVQKKKLMTPLFSSAMCSHAYIRLAAEGIEQFIVRIKEQNAQAISLHGEMERLVYDTSYRMIFGRSADSDLEALVKISGQSEFSFSSMVPLWIPTPTSVRFRKDGNRLKDIFVRGIENFKKNPIEGCVMSGLLKSSLTDNELLDEAFSVHFGVSAVATTMTWTLFQLAYYQEVQQRLKSELSNAATPYLDAALNECMRMIPAFFGSVRYSDIDVNIGGFTFPGKSTFMPLRYFAQTHESFWENPTKFDPDRFLKTEGTTVNPLAFIPFGLGARKCLGSNLAPELVKYFVVKLLKNFEFSTDQIPGNFEFRYGIYPKNEILLTYKVREENHNESC